MIPRHRPSVGVSSMFWQMMPGARATPTIEQVERSWAERLDVPHAVWLPSGRYGICRAIQFAVPADAPVYSPVFTCGVVHEAIARSTRDIRLVDCSDAHFLMDDERLSKPAGTAHGIILSEVFGYRYLAQLDLPLVRHAGLRIFDMAMCLPHIDDLKRLRGSDVALISFGLGKPLYAGWGGMAFTRDPEMAAWLCQHRQQDVASGHWRHNAEMAARTLAHSPLCYGLLKRIIERRRSTDEAADSVQAADGRLRILDQLPSPSRDWRHGPTPFHLRTADRHAHMTAAFAKERRELAQHYHACLSAELSAHPGLGRGPMPWAPATDDALSHFCITVADHLRDPLRNHLWQHGIDTAVLFEFPAGLHASDFPHAAAHSRGVLGLPLWSGLDVRRIRRICDCILDFLRQNVSRQGTGDDGTGDDGTGDHGAGERAAARPQWSRAVSASQPAA